MFCTLQYLIYLIILYINIYISYPNFNILGLFSCSSYVGVSSHDQFSENASHINVMWTASKKPEYCEWNLVLDPWIFLTVLLMYNGLKVYNLTIFDICLHPWNIITIMIMKIFIIPKSLLLHLCNLSFPPLPSLHLFPISRDYLYWYPLIRTLDTGFKAPG